MFRGTSSGAGGEARSIEACSARHGPGQDALLHLFMGRVSKHALLAMAPAVSRLSRRRLEPSLEAWPWAEAELRAPTSNPNPNPNRPGQGQS